MKTSAKIALGCLVVGGLFFFLLLAAFFHAANGFDASKEDPRKLYAFYVQKQMPPTLKVHKAIGGGTPFGGTGVAFKFEIGQTNLDELISSKQLQKVDSLQPGLFSETDLDSLKHAEFYATEFDTTWRASPPTSVRMAVDRESGVVLYYVFSP